MSETSGSARQVFDWAQIKERLREASSRLEQDVQASDLRHKADVLRQRAQFLARDDQVDTASAQEAVEVVEFMLAYERYALEAACVREVHPLKEITPLPGTPSWVAGIVNVRGRIVSVVNLKVLFELPDRGLTDLNKVLVLDDGQMEFGLLVDAMLGVWPLPLRDIQPPLATTAAARFGYVRGVTARRVAVLDARKLLCDPSMVVRPEA